MQNKETRYYSYDAPKVLKFYSPYGAAPHYPTGRVLRSSARLSQRWFSWICVYLVHKSPRANAPYLQHKCNHDGRTKRQIDDSPTEASNWERGNPGRLQPLGRGFLCSRAIRGYGYTGSYFLSGHSHIRLHGGSPFARPPNFLRCD